MAAPGVNIQTTDLTLGGILPNLYVYVSGTSFAAPHVAGVVALLQGAYGSNLTPSEIKEILTNKEVIAIDQLTPNE